MRIQSFNVSNQRSVINASCDKVPTLMVIAGPNGAGKSTLLNSLRTQSGEGKIIYIGPHRTARKQQVQARHLFQQKISLEDLMAGPSMPGMEGIGLVTGQRDPWGFDDAVNYLKHGLCQIEIDRQQAVTAIYDRDGSIPKDVLPDVWQPLRNLAENLLPHLRFKGIDTTNRDAVRCEWEVHRKGLIVDLDDLSSGEKSIIQMFYPIIEHQIRSLLGSNLPQPVSTPRQEVCVLIDEPELHLHPNLQAKVLDYLRVLTSEEGIQVIVATHSPNIVEYATYDELFILRPVEFIQPSENQIIQVATSEERLRYLRDTFGSTANLTSFQPILIIEGGDKEERARRVTDRKLYHALHAKFDRITIIPGGGKSDCQRLRDVLCESLATFTEKLQVTALLDRDLADAEPSGGFIRLLPVSMIENLLLDPEVIWEAIQSVVEKTGFKSPQDVSAALDAILDEREGQEIDRRVVNALGTLSFRPHGPAEEIISQAEEFAHSVTETYSPEKVSESVSIARDKVKRLRSENRRREFFHGKSVVETFFKRHLHNTGLSKEIFRYEAARYARQRTSVSKFFDQLLASLIPDELAL